MSSEAGDHLPGRGLPSKYWINELYCEKCRLFLLLNANLLILQHNVVGHTPTKKIEELEVGLGEKAEDHSPLLPTNDIFVLMKETVMRHRFSMYPLVFLKY